ncbi:hypothetical protein JWS04_34250 [Bradyrhizobium vignae]|uniref:Uncharacterized protein n=2 Tax=Bradyrhizobium vignae TaxID=1549949 RepID=A0ABS4A8P1_9BRAD|nr:hypothetical protein [Bradyrhizobium vignae]
MAAQVIVTAAAHLASYALTGSAGFSTAQLVLWSLFRAAASRCRDMHVEGAMTARLDDLDLVRRIGERSKRLSASLGSAIHPSHIPVINEICSTS